MSFKNQNASRDEALNYFIDEGVLTFGEFTLRSGRPSPYFFNTGSLCSGSQLSRLGKLYARALHTHAAFNDATIVFGSAYKGIRIRRWSSARGEPRCSTAIAMSASPSSSWVMP